jgi:hypothetical protein
MHLDVSPVDCGVGCGGVVYGGACVCGGLGLLVADDSHV